MQEAWFAKWPKQANVGLPLPTDKSAPKLTDAELVLLGAAIQTRKSKLENWFRYQRKKVGNADSAGPVNGAMAKTIKSLFNLTPSKRKRAPQTIQVFQKHNAELIAESLTVKGYAALKSTADNADNWTDEADGSAAADLKSRKSAAMRVRTRVINALWKQASQEEKDACDEAVREETEKLRAATLQEEAEPKIKTAMDFQDGIDAVDFVAAEVQKGIFNAAGWVSMLITGGPNPRLGGELSVKIICFGETSAGNDFEDSCIDFDKNVVEPFEGFMRHYYTAEECQSRALPTRPSTSNAERVAHITPPAPAPPVDPRKPKRSGQRRANCLP
ncbi:hypothetical protein B0H19DRAFT_1272120 [Mycena capillaripes]|nr:hypothetical protein B0H19DRAFT_1272120 [Mycena capillaripes]